MFKNYLKTSFNNIVRNKLYSAINIFGLAVAMCCCTLISLFVIDELSYDRDFVNEDRIYRITRYFNPVDGMGGMDVPTNAPMVAPLLKENYSEVEETARIIAEPVSVRHEENTFYEDRFRLADNSFFTIFTFDWLQGDVSTALLDPFTVVITESSAEKYFGAADPMGQTLTIEGKFPFRVTGVIRDLPTNTHLSGDLFGSFTSIPAIFGEGELRRWGSNNYYTYITLHEGVDIETLESQFPEFMERFYREDSSDRTGMKAMKLSDIHLHGQRQFTLSPPGNIRTIWTFISIALCVLGIACINFTNISIARFSHRAKEVGMRMSIGASHKQIVAQFLSESVLFAFLAMLLSLMMVELLLPWFSGFVGKTLSFSYLSDFKIPLSLIGLTVLLGLVAGSYPAFYIASFKPGAILKGEVTKGKGGQAFRNLLVVLQFSIATALVIATAVIFSQLKYAQSIELGFQKNQIVVLEGSSTEGLGEQWPAMKNRLLSHPNISHVTASRLLPGELNLNAAGVMVEGGNPKGQAMAYQAVDYGFFETYEVDIVSGRTFDPIFSADVDDETQSQVRPGFIINERAVRQFGWGNEDAIGKSFNVNGRQGRIIGVAEDVYYEPIHESIRPMFYFMPPEGARHQYKVGKASIKIQANNISGTLGFIDEVWKEFLPQHPIRRHFLDADFERLYQNEEKQGKIIAYFSSLAIFIACIGLFGLASFNVEKRTKEIGVRKVLGGSVWSIVLLLTSDFSKLVLLSNIIAWPLAYIVMSGWLENFAYRIDLTPVVFIGSGLIALCIAWVTVGGTAARAASVKPVLALRYE